MLLPAIISSCRLAKRSSSLGANIGIDNSIPELVSFSRVLIGGRAMTAHANGRLNEGRPSMMLVEAVAEVMTVADLLGPKPDVIENESSVTKDVRRFDPKLDNKSDLEPLRPKSPLTVSVSDLIFIAPFRTMRHTR